MSLRSQLLSSEYQFQTFRDLLPKLGPKRSKTAVSGTKQSWAGAQIVHNGGSWPPGRGCGRRAWGPGWQRENGNRALGDQLYHWSGGAQPVA